MARCLVGQLAGCLVGLARGFLFSFSSFSFCFSLCNGGVSCRLDLF